jgi:hypothetical protein
VVDLLPLDCVLARGTCDDEAVEDVPNNPLKLPFFVLMLMIAIVFVVVSAVGHEWVTVAILASCLPVGIHAIHVIRQGRNPWWLRSPLDRRWRKAHD